VNLTKAWSLRFGFSLALVLGVVGVLFVLSGVRSLVDGGDGRDARESFAIGCLVLAVDAFVWRAYVRRLQP
jgi:hypothetical protein